MHTNKSRVLATFSSLLLTVINPLSATGQTTSSPTSIAQQSCEGIGNPLSKANLDARAQNLDIGDRNNSQVLENAFERFSVPSMSVLALQGGAIVEIRAQPNTKPYPSGARTVQTGGAYKSVEPDGVAPLLVAIRTQKPKGITLVNYKESIFYDAKAVVGRISLSVENYQALGFVDALTQSDAGKLYNTPKAIRPTPRLIYLTTSDTIIGNSTIGRQQEKVLLCFST